MSADKLREILEQGVRDGHVEVCGTSEDGQPRFRLTDAGRRYVEEELLPEIGLSREELDRYALAWKQGDER